MFVINSSVQDKLLLHVLLGSIPCKDTQQKLVQDPNINKSATCRLQTYIMTTDPKDATKNSLTLLLVCDYLTDKEPTDEEINYSRTLFAYNILDINCPFIKG